MLRISLSTNAFFFMFARHMRSGSPWTPTARARTRRRSACRPHRQRGVHEQLASLADLRDQIVNRDLAQDIAGALRLARVALNQPAVRRLTLAIGSPVEK
jgi:hypothetical protein